MLIHARASALPLPQGVHYGVFPGEFDAQGGLMSVWNVLRPHNWHPQSSEEHLLHLDVTSGALLPQNTIPWGVTSDLRPVPRSHTAGRSNSIDRVRMWINFFVPVLFVGTRKEKGCMHGRGIPLKRGIVFDLLQCVFVGRCLT